MSGERGQQRLSIRCSKCCGRYRYIAGEIRSPLTDWPGFEFTTDPPTLKRTYRTDGRFFKTHVRCLRSSCRHEWWTVMFDAIERAVHELGYKSVWEARRDIFPVYTRIPL